MSRSLVSIGLVSAVAAIAFATALPHRVYAHEHEPSADAHSDEPHGHSDGDIGHDGAHGMGHDSNAVEAHDHGTLSIPEDQPIPAVALTVHDDALRGWNLELTIENFALAPEQVNQASSAAEGHAHLYVNGVKITRLYGPWYYLESLPSGSQELRVELNANGHEVLMHDGKAIGDTVIINVP
ncbi:MAG: hypothetical protein WBA10_18770 [Elainellaceae cyanobacterium]